MLKFLLILSLSVYIVYKIGSFFFRAGAASQHYRNQQPRNYQPKDPNGKKKTTFKGGDYIDYEEIK
jgi:hypothetical protein